MCWRCLPLALHALVRALTVSCQYTCFQVTIKEAIITALEDMAFALPDGKAQRFDHLHEDRSRNAISVQDALWSKISLYRRATDAAIALLRLATASAVL